MYRVCTFSEVFYCSCLEDVFIYINRFPAVFDEDHFIKISFVEDEKK